MRCLARCGKPPLGARSADLLPGGFRTPFLQVRQYPKANPQGRDGRNGRAALRPRGTWRPPKGVIARAFYRRMVHETGKGTLQLLAAQTQYRAEV